MADYSSNSSYKQYRILADTVEWKNVNVNELFKKQIENENNELGEAYFAALACRFFGYAGRIYTQCNHHVTFEDCHDCIIDAIRYVLAKRVWENPESSLYEDPNGPDKAIHIAMKRQKGIMLSRMSAQRRMTNFNTMSIDEAHENFNDSADGLLFGYDMVDVDTTRELISSYFYDANTYIDGIILDCLCFGNFKLNSEDLYSCIIKELRRLNKNSENYFVDAYFADRDNIIKSFIEIKKTNNKHLEMKIKSILYKLREELKSND